MFDRYLIEHCSPTLASLKTANLFRYTCGGEELEEQLRHWNESLGEKGVSLLVLRRQEGTALLYVCRKERLQKELNQPEIARFLSGYGYDQMDVDYALERLQSRLAKNTDFPHEIGIFLGYPLGDVIGFIQNAGQNCKCTGCWKVYCNECEAIRIFAKFKKCRDVYMRLWKQGRSILQLTVAA